MNMCFGDNSKRPGDVTVQKGVGVMVWFSEVRDAPDEPPTVRQPTGVITSGTSTTGVHCAIRFRWTWFKQGMLQSTLWNDSLGSQAFMSITMHGEIRCGLRNQLEASARKRRTQFRLQKKHQKPPQPKLRTKTKAGRLPRSSSTHRASEALLSMSTLSTLGSLNPESRSPNPKLVIYICLKVRPHTRTEPVVYSSLCKTSSLRSEHTPLG